MTPGSELCLDRAGASLTGAAFAAAVARGAAFAARAGRLAAFLAGVRVPLPATVNVSSSLRAPFVDKTTCLHSDKQCSRPNDESAGL
jgi:hypothetical protein